MHLQPGSSIHEYGYWFKRVHVCVCMRVCVARGAASVFHSKHGMQSPQQENQHNKIVQRTEKMDCETAAAAAAVVVAKYLTTRKSQSHTHSEASEQANENGGVRDTEKTQQLNHRPKKQWFKL